MSTPISLKYTPPLRLREVTEDDGTVTRKLSHKVRICDGPQNVACTNFYLDDDEWAMPNELPTRTLAKPEWLHVTTEVTHDERWTGAGLARLR